MAGRHVIGRCTVLPSARGPDPAAARAWAERALARADLDDVVAPAATLVLRHAAVPARGAAPALRARAQEAATQAARPVHGVVGARAQAVLFADDAELLACLARDLLAGVLPTAWWWASARSGGGDPLQWMTRVWAERAVAMPAALHALAATGHAASFLRALPDDTVAALAGAAAKAGVVPAALVARSLGARAARGPGGGGTGDPDTTPGRRASTGPDTDSHAYADAVRALGPVPDGPAARLGVALLLAHRDPSALQTLAGAPTDVRRAGAEEAAPPGAPAPIPRPPAPAARQGRRRAREQGPAARDDDPHRPPARRRLLAPAPTRLHTRPHRPGAKGPDREPARGAPAKPTAAATAAGHDETPAPVSTRLAGTFLLVTVAQDLGLYGDFTQPRMRGLDLSPWAWLAHTAAHLAGVRDPADPLWSLLAGLAGDPGLEPGDAPALRATSRRVAHRLDRALVRRRSARHVVVRPGVVHAGPVRIDVVFPLATLDLGIRLSGLDRDPGWLPAGARDVRLHYR